MEARWHLNSGVHRCRARRWCGARRSGGEGCGRSGGEGHGRSLRWRRQFACCRTVRQAGGAMGREEYGWSHSGTVEMPAGGCKDAVENTEVARRSAIAALWCIFFRNCGDWRAFSRIGWASGLADRSPVFGCWIRWREVVPMASAPLGGRSSAGALPSSRSRAGSSSGSGSWASEVSDLVADPATTSTTTTTTATTATVCRSCVYVGVIPTPHL
jgi:hypothetical protein